mmetsp:Transcript_155289/g.275447  ORF Transcript_155289/g.275447 Transcript_155289/m.275447 type:complete len:291 (+) Transcript_155289:78-950(+)
MGCGASARPSDKDFPEEAPLKDYYRDMLDMTEAELQEVWADSMQFWIMSKAEQDEYKKQRAEQFEEALTPSIQETFDHYDNGFRNGLLDREESAQLFKDVVLQNQDFIVAISRFAVLGSNDAAGQKYMAMRRSGCAFQDSPVVESVMQEKECRAQLMRELGPKALEATGQTDSEMIAWARLATYMCVKDYIADKVARDAAAFNVLDHNRDGQLQKDEVVAVFKNPEGAKFKRLLQAMGVDGQAFKSKLHELQFATEVSAAAAQSAEEFKAKVMSEHPAVFWHRGFFGTRS